MKSVRLQLLVTLMAAAAAAGILIHRGPLPSMSFPQAVILADLAEIGRHVRWGLDLNGCTRSGRTPLGVAVTARQTEVVKLLLALGADPDQPAEPELAYKWSALHIAAAHPAYPDLTRVLMEAGADANIKDEQGMTPLHVAARYGGLEQIAILCSHGADPRGRPGRPPPICCSGTKEAAALLTSLGADPRQCSAFGRSLLHSAVVDRHPDVLEWAISQGLDVNGKDRNGSTPLHLAVYFGRREMAKALLMAGDDPNVHNNMGGGTPLHVAARQGQKDFASLLLEYGARADEPDEDGTTPLRDAEEYGHQGVANLLRRHGSRQ